MCAILTGSRLGAYSRLMLNKPEGKESFEEKEKESCLPNACLFRDVSHKTTKSCPRSHALLDPKMVSNFDCFFFSLTQIQTFKDENS